MNLIDDVLPWVVFLLGLSVPMLAITLELAERSVSAI
jgi:hypothetical protein